MKQLMQAVQSALEQNGLWRADARLLCAVSGGCDSIALLHTLCRLRLKMPFALEAVHVQHGLRGEDSLQDERFTREACITLNVPLTVEDAGLSGDMHSPGMETLARESRRRIFEKQLAACRADALLTAHHLDDQAETVLMHLLRGSGLHGLCGMQTSVPFGSAVLLRPFLNLSKLQLRNALASEGLECREDGSNQEAVTPRNALRLEVLPKLENLFPGARQHMAQLAESLLADEAYLCAETERLYAAACYARDSLFMISADLLKNAPEALQRRVLRRWYQEGLKTAGMMPDERALSYADTLALQAVLHRPAGTRVNLPCGLMAAREQRWLHLTYQSGETLGRAAAWETPVSAGPFCYSLPHMVLTASAAVRIPQDARSILLSPAWLERKLMLRPPQTGDVIRPFGAPGSKPLRRWMTDRRIDPFLRPVLPVLCDGNEILWVPGLCTSEALRVKEIPSGTVELKLSGETPFIPTPPKE